MGRQLANMVLESTFTKLTVLRGTQCLFIKKKWRAKHATLSRLWKLTSLALSFVWKIRKISFLKSKLEHLKWSHCYIKACTTVHIYIYIYTVLIRIKEIHVKAVRFWCTCEYLFIVTNYIKWNQSLDYVEWFHLSVHLTLCTILFTITIT